MTAPRSRGRKVFYGWWIVLGSAVAHFFSGAFYFYGFSAFFMPLVQEFGWSRTALSGAFSMSRIEGGLLGPLGGFLVDTFGPRKTMLFGMALMGFGFWLVARVDSLLSFYLAFILCVAAGSTLGIHQAALVAVANWFIRKRGTAMGVGMSGVGLGGILVPVIAWLITEYGWRDTSEIIAFTLWAVAIPLALLMRHRPEQYGYLPDGDTPQSAGPRTEVKQGSRQPATHTEVPADAAIRDISFTPRQAMRTWVFWVLCLSFALRQLVVNAVVVHQMPFLAGLGISPQVAATMLGSLALLSIVGRLGFGRLADVMNKRYVLAACLVLMAIGCLILAVARTWWHVVIFLVIYSPAYGGGVILMLAIRGEYFGRRYFGTIMGLMDLVQMLGTVSGPVFAGWVYDVTGSYRYAFLSFAAASLIALVLALLARRPVYRWGMPAAGGQGTGARAGGL